jgi:hypothetical protein
MDFRAMLAKRKYAKWGKQEEKLEYDLKETPKDDKPKLKHIERVRTHIIINLLIYIYIN